MILKKYLPLALCLVPAATIGMQPKEINFGDLCKRVARFGKRFPDRFETLPSGEIMHFGEGICLNQFDLPKNEDGSWKNIHAAAFACDPDAVQKFIAFGADVNQLDEHGDTALHYAVSRHAVSCAELLCKAGADPKIAGRDGVTPFDLCAIDPRGYYLQQSLEKIIAARKQQDQQKKSEPVVDYTKVKARLSFFGLGGQIAELRSEQSPTSHPVQQPSTSSEMGVVIDSAHADLIQLLLVENELLRKEKQELYDLHKTTIAGGQWYADDWAVSSYEDEEKQDDPAYFKPQPAVIAGGAWDKEDSWQDECPEEKEAKETLRRSSRIAAKRREELDEQDAKKSKK